MRRWLSAVCIVLAALAAAAPAHADDKPELVKVRLAVGGKPALFYLPLTVVERLGLFREQGLEVEISDFPGGARALQALMGGSADVVTGSFDHTIPMPAKGQPVVGPGQLRPLSGYRLALPAC